MCWEQQVKDLVVRQRPFNLHSLHKVFIAANAIAEQCFKIFFIPHYVQPFCIHMCEIHESAMYDFSKKIFPYEQFQLYAIEFEKIKIGAQQRTKRRCLHCGIALKRLIQSVQDYPYVAVEFSKRFVQDLERVFMVNNFLRSIGIFCQVGEFDPAIYLLWASRPQSNQVRPQRCELGAAVSPS